MIKREEILSILGCGSDPMHSLGWYTKHHPEMKKEINKQIQEDINKAKVFPLEAACLSEKVKCERYSQIIIKKNEEEFIVQENDTDRSIAIKQKQFKKIEEATNWFVERAFCAGGAIIEFLR